MPLRITIELIPHGEESRKRKLVVVNIENDGTAGDGRGNGEVGNYHVSATGGCGEAGWDDFAAFTIGPLNRGNYVDICAEVLASLHSQILPENGSVTHGVLSKFLSQRADDGSNIKNQAP